MSCAQRRRLFADLRLLFDHQLAADDLLLRFIHKLRQIVRHQAVEIGQIGDAVRHAVIVILPDDGAAAGADVLNDQLQRAAKAFSSLTINVPTLPASTSFINA